MAKMKFTFTDVNGEIEHGSGIYDDEQAPDGSTMKERIAALKIKWPTSNYNEWPATDDIQPSGEVFHVKDRKLIKWTQKELEDRAKAKRKIVLEGDMAKTQAEITACDNVSGIDMTQEKARLQAELDEKIAEHNSLSAEAMVVPK